MLQIFTWSKKYHFWYSCFSSFCFSNLIFRFSGFWVFGHFGVSKLRNAFLTFVSCFRGLKMDRNLKIWEIPCYHLNNTWNTAIWPNFKSGKWSGSNSYDFLNFAKEKILNPHFREIHQLLSVIYRQWHIFFQFCKIFLKEYNVDL